MSLINQVLNELEHRGANTPLSGNTIRAIPPRQPSHLKRYALLALALLVLLVAIWLLVRTDTAASGRPVIKTIPISVGNSTTSGVAIATASAPGEAVAAIGVSGVSASLSMGSLHGKPLLEVKSEDQPVTEAEVKKSAHLRPKLAQEQTADHAEDLSTESAENLQLKKVSPQQRAESEFQKANLAAQEGRTNDALVGYEAALLIDSSHKAARRAWVGMLLSLKRNEDAERVLQRGIKRDPKDTSFAMLLARLQVERGEVPLALETLQKTLPYAEGQADYQAFVAALFQRQSRHDEAIAQYQVALKLSPKNGIWWMGLGISQQALQHKEEARDAFQRALATNNLSAQLQAFVQQKLKEL